MAVPYKSLRKVAPLASRVIPPLFYALGFVTALVSTIYLATRYVDSLPSPYHPRNEKEKPQDGKSIDNKLN